MPSIYERIKDDMTLKERQLWTALTSADPGHAVNKLCSPDANLVFPEKGHLALDPDNPDKNQSKLEKLLAPPFHRFDDFSLTNVRPIVIDLMAGTITYTVSAYRGKNEYRATGSTTWAQASDGEWRVVVHQETML
jgi:hypothetical protein